MTDLPVKWQFSASATQWWRIGAWLFVDLSMPMISVHLFWWTFGFGRMLDVKTWKAQVKATVTTTTPLRPPTTPKAAPRLALRSGRG